MTASPLLNIAFGLTLTTLPNIPSLRNYGSLSLNKGDCIIVSGNAASGDHGGGLFTWSPTSMDADDGGSTIQPVDRGASAGRWQIITPLNQAAIAGLISGLASSTSLAGAGGAALIGTEQPFSNAIANTVSGKLGQRFDLTDWGTLAECQADVGIVLNRAMTDLAAVGGTIMLPMTIMNISTPVVMAAGVTLDGGSWIEINANTACFSRTNTTIVPFTFPYSSPGGGIKNVSFKEAQTVVSASTWAPIIYPAWITALGSGSHFQNLHFGGCYAAFVIGSLAAATGRQLIENVRGEFFGVGIDLINCQDVVRIRGFHNWPYYSGTAAGTQAYARTSTTAIRASQVDSLQIDDSFMTSVQVGLKVVAASSATRLKISNLDVRSCAVGVQLDAQCFASLANVTTIDTDTVGVQVSANSTGSIVSLTNYEGADSKNNLIRLDGTSNTMMVSNASLQNWNSSAIGFSAVSCNTGNLLRVSNITFGGTGGNFYDASGTITGVSDIGTFAASTDANGQVVITCPQLVGLTPSHVDVSLISSADLVYSVVSTGPGTFTIRLATALNSVPLASTSVVFSWRASV